MIETILTSADEIAASKVAVIIILLLIVTAMGFIIRRLYNDNQEMAANQAKRFKEVADEIAASSLTASKVARVMILFAQTNPAIKESGIDVKALLDD